MIYKRVAARLRAQDWVAITIELTIVVVGVFLGTQANNWNQTRIDRATASQYRREIIDDLKSNETDMESRQAYYGAVRTHAISALAAIEDPSGKTAEPFLIDAYQASQVWLRPLVRTGYEEMTGAGLTGGIGDREERSRLTNYYTQIRQFDVTALGTTSYRERLRRVMPYLIQLAVQRRCGDRVITLPGGSQIAALPDTCTLGLDPAVVALGVSRLKKAELGEDLTRHIADLDQKLAGFERFGRQAHRNRLQLQHMESQ